MAAIVLFLAVHHSFPLYFISRELHNNKEMKADFSMLLLFFIHFTKFEILRTTVLPCE